MGAFFFLHRTIKSYFPKQKAYQPSNEA